MADNATITNRKTTFDADTNPDIATRAVEKNALKSQVVIVDYGGAGAENLAVPDFATQATLSELNGKVTACNTNDVTISDVSESDGGFFANVWALLQLIYDSIRAPEFMTVVAGGKKLQAITTADSAIGTVSTVTTVTTVTTASTVTNLTNLNTIDSREMIWGIWNDVYYNGIRSKIT